MAAVCTVWSLCALSADPTVPPGNTMRPGQGDEQDSLFPAHDKQEIIPRPYTPPYTTLNFAYIPKAFT